MSLMRVTFAGEIKKAETKQVGGKTLVEFSVCKKNKTKEGEESHYTWLKVQCWEAPEWLAAKLVKGVFVAGAGDLTIRSYEKQDGTKGASADVRCSSYDLELPYSGEKREAVHEPTQRAAPKVINKMSPVAAIIHDPDNSQPPF